MLTYGCSHLGITLDIVYCYLTSLLQLFLGNRMLTPTLNKVSTFFISSSIFSIYADKIYNKVSLNAITSRNVTKHKGSTYKRNFVISSGGTTWI